MKAIQCASLTTGEGQTIAPATMTVEGDRIVDVTKGLSAGEGQEIIDYRACHVLPGLVDSHDHFGIDMGDGEPAAQQDRQWRAIKGVKNARRMVESGITTLRNTGELWNMGAFVRRAIEEGWIVGPRTVLSGIPISSTGGHGWFVGREADGPDEVRLAVRENVKMGADMIKMIITGGVTTPGGTVVRTCFNQAEVETAIYESHLAEKQIGVHCYGGPAASWAIKAGVDIIDHGTYLTDEQLGAMAERGTYLVSTSSVMKAAATAPHVVEFMRERFHRISLDYVDLLKRARSRGVKVVVGCDTNHAHLADEVATLLDAGYTPQEALAAATIEGARMLRREAEVGSLARGKLADFVIVREDPGRDLVRAMTTVERVAKGGQFEL